MAKSIGKVSQIIGPVVDVEFNGKGNSLPNIYDALEIENSWLLFDMYKLSFEQDIIELLFYDLKKNS